MDKAFWLVIVPPLLAGLAVSLLLERQIRPHVWAVWRRGFPAFCAHTAAWLLLFCAELALFRRPWLAAANVCALIYIFVLISNAKWQSLREPFIYQDIDYCVDVLKHPRLYLPFLGWSRALLGLGAVVAVLYVGMSMETSLLERVPVQDFVLGLAGLLGAVFIFMCLAVKVRTIVLHKPDVDLPRLGFLACLWAYALAEKRSWRGPPQSVAPPNMTIRSRALPNLVVVQSESFFDVRRLFPTVREDVFGAYDHVVRAACHHGRVFVPAWGANTVRTEFAFLSGLAPSSLGIDQFNPYRSLIRRPFPTLASHLRSQGYETVCVHPYPASFYRRNHVFPLLGFDRFLDIEAFTTRDQSSPYVDDVTLARKLCEVLDGGDTKPRFVFVITMENHGPLHLEPREPAKAADLFTGALPAGCDDLPVYLRHMVNANLMIDILRTHIDSLTRPGWMCWYGDHVPIMNRVYRTIGFPDGSTDYFIWEKGGAPSVDARSDLQIETLAPLLLRKMGFDDWRTVKS